MAGISSIGSLQETLYYQYLINNNSTSTMLNALNGTAGEDSGENSLLSTLGSVQSGLDLSGISSDSLGQDVSDMLGSVGWNDFSSILESYISLQQTENAQMADKLSAVLEEASETEDTSSLSYRTVQELYQYFLEQTSNDSSSLPVSAAAEEQASQNSGAAEVQSMAGGYFEEVDFDALEEELQTSAEASLPSAFL